MRSKIVLVIACLFLTSDTVSQENTRNVPADGNQRMSFQSNRNGPSPPNNFNPQRSETNVNAHGPWNQDVVVYRVEANGIAMKIATFERAGVPTIARFQDGRLLVAHQHFPENDQESFDKVAVRFSIDDGKTWGEPKVIRVEGLPEGMRFPFDPTLVPLPDGKMRLYFTGNMGQNFGPSTPAIHSAISTDGVDYQYEPGMRFGVAGRMVIDCAAVLHQGMFHLFAPDNGVQLQPGQPLGTESIADRPREGIGYHAISVDGLNFSRIDDVQIEGRRRWLGNAQSDGESIRFFGTGEAYMQSPNEMRRGGIWSAESPDGKQWKLVPSASVSIADPGAISTSDTSWIIVGTGPIVRGPMSNIARSRNAFNRFPNDLELLKGPLRFNHPAGLASDGKNLVMVDQGNNRVLIWNEAPASNTPPDLVLGQTDFIQNKAGAERHQLNSPSSIAISPDGHRILIADSGNGRVLCWDRFPNKNGAAADFELNVKAVIEENPLAQSDGVEIRQDREWTRNNVGGIWTDGKKLAVVVPSQRSIMIWNTIPSERHPLPIPNSVLRPHSTGIPTHIISDGSTFFAISVIQIGNRDQPLTMVWNSFPTAESQQPDWTWMEGVKGSFSSDGKLSLGGEQAVYLWNKPPRDEKTDADVVLRPTNERTYGGQDVIIVNDRIYVASIYRNQILGWKAVATRDNQPADFLIGSERNND